ncbi:MAG: lipoprotein [Comamonas sp.]|nr:lipoprotein [Comamonas sp.]
MSNPLPFARIWPLCLCLAAAFLLSACGQRGPLYLPTEAKTSQTHVHANACMASTPAHSSAAQQAAMPQAATYTT